MGCGCKCGCVSALLSQEVGSAYYYVRLVADNIQLLQDLAAQMEAADPGQVINILRGTTAQVAYGTIAADEDNSHIAVTPELGNTDDITTIVGDPDGRVIVLRPSSEAYTLTLKAIAQKAITSVDPFLDEFTVIGHGLVTGQLIGLSGPGLPADVVAGAYYAVATGADTFKVAATKADAMAGIVLEVVNAGAGWLDIGNLELDGDLVLTGRETAMLVKDGSTYSLLGSSAVLPSVINVTNELQPINDLLTAISQLVLEGQAGNFIQVNATEDGFEIVDFGLDELNAALAAKADQNHTHTIDQVEGLTEALASKQAAGDYAGAAHNHDDRYFTETESDARYQQKITVSTVLPTGADGNNDDIWFKVAS